MFVVILHRRNVGCQDNRSSRRGIVSEEEGCKNADVKIGM